MSLAQMNWTRVSMHKVVWAWLRAERDTKVARRLSQLPELLWSPGLSKLLDHPDFENPNENRARLRILYMIRSLFVVEIPPDTVWYEVCNLTDSELGELRTVNYGDWTEAAEQNQLAKVAARKRLALGVPPSDWDPPILWGHGKNGLFTILEGNHRLAAYVASGRSDLNIPAFVGLSPTACVWHILDHCTSLMQDLIRHQ
jgi:hypothetical protein